MRRQFGFRSANRKAAGLASQLGYLTEVCPWPPPLLPGCLASYLPVRLHLFQIWCADLFSHHLANVVGPPPCMSSSFSGYE